MVQSIPQRDALPDLFQLTPLDARRDAERHVDYIIQVCVFAATAWLYRPLAFLRFDEYDLGAAAYGAMRMSGGFIPYRDSALPYGPGQYYVRALLFHIFGPSFVVMGMEWYIGAASFAALCYWVLRGCTGRWTALLLTAVIASIAGFAVAPHWLAYIGLIMMVGCFVRYTYAADRDMRWLVATGIGLGVLIATRWDFGAWAMLTMGMALILLSYLRHTLAPEDAPARSHFPVRSLLLLFGVAGGTALPWYAPALFTDPSAIIRTMRLSLLAQSYRGLPYPTLPSLRAILHGNMTFAQFLDTALVVFPAYAFPLIGLVNLVTVAIVLQKQHVFKPSVPLVMHTVVTTFLGFGLFLYGRTRPDLGHTLPTTLCMLLSLPVSLWLITQLRDAFPERAAVLRELIAIPIMAIIVPATLFGVQSLAERWSAPQPSNPFTTPELKGATINPGVAAEYDALVTYIKRHTAPNEFIFSGLVRHDVVNIADTTLYFATERQAATRYDHLAPGVTTRRDVQQEIIQALQRHHVRLLVLADFNLPTEPNASRESSGVTDLDTYISAHYAIQEKFPEREGEYYVLLSRDVANIPCAQVPYGTQLGSIDWAINPANGGNMVKSDGQVKIYGWSALPAGSPPARAVEVRVNGQVVGPVLQCIPRDDLSAAFGEGARNGGWEVTVDMRRVPGIGPATVTAEAIDAAGNRHPLPVSQNIKLEITP